jgi:hypothetical protein
MMSLPAGLHAVLHKIEGDESNSRYWYRRSSQAYEAYAEPKGRTWVLNKIT